MLLRARQKRPHPDLSHIWGIHLIALSILGYGNSACALALPEFPIERITWPIFSDACVNKAASFDSLDDCKFVYDGVRSDLEEQNTIIKNYCDSLNSKDREIRDAIKKEKKIKWKEYESIKSEIQLEIQKCNTQSGEYYSPYRKRMQDFVRISQRLAKKRNNIVRGIYLGGT